MGKKIWTEAAVREEAAKYESKDEFRKGHRYAHRRAYHMGLLNELFPHRKPIRWTLEAVKTEARKYPDMKTFRKKQDRAYEAAAIRDWLGLLSFTKAA